MKTIEKFATTMEIIYKRICNQSANSKHYISGSLIIDGQTICDTEENAFSALPVGEYRIVRHHCKQYTRYMLLVLPYSFQELALTARCNNCKLIEHEGLNATMTCQCPMLKPGNGVRGRTDGSIILGTRIVPGCLIHPVQAFNPLAERIRKAVSRGKVITLKIVEQ